MLRIARGGQKVVRGWVEAVSLLTFFLTLTKRKTQHSRVRRSSMVFSSFILSSFSPRTHWKIQREPVFCRLRNPSSKQPAMFLKFKYRKESRMERKKKVSTAQNYDNRSQEWEAAAGRAGKAVIKTNKTERTSTTAETETTAVRVKEREFQNSNLNGRVECELRVHLHLAGVAHDHLLIDLNICRFVNLPSITFKAKKNHERRSMAVTEDENDV